MSTIKTAVAGMITACSAALWGCSGDKAPAEQEVPVVMVAQPGAAQPEQHSYAGDVQAQEQTALAFRVAGQVAERYADVGDQVKAGQVLARLDAKDAQLQLNAARAQLESAQSAARITLATVKVSIVPSAPRFASGCAPSSALTTAGWVRMSRLPVTLISTSPGPTSGATFSPTTTSFVPQYWMLCMARSLRIC